MPKSKPKPELTFREKRLVALIEALNGVISWYETEHERSSYEEESVPEDLRDAEAELEKADQAVRENDKGVLP